MVNQISLSDHLKSVGSLSSSQRCHQNSSIHYLCLKRNTKERGSLDARWRSMEPVCSCTSTFWQLLLLPLLPSFLIFILPPHPRLLIPHDFHGSFLHHHHHVGVAGVWMKMRFSLDEHVRTPFRWKPNKVLFVIYCCYSGADPRTLGFVMDESPLHHM